MIVRNWHLRGARKTAKSNRNNVRLHEHAVSSPGGVRALAVVILKFRDEDTVDTVPGADYLDLTMTLDETRALKECLEKILTDSDCWESERREGEDGQRCAPKPCDKYRPYVLAPGYCWCGWFRDTHGPGRISPQDAAVNQGLADVVDQAKRARKGRGSRA